MLKIVGLLCKIIFFKDDFGCIVFGYQVFCIDDLCDKVDGFVIFDFFMSDFVCKCFFYVFVFGDEFDYIVYNCFGCFDCVIFYFF